MRREYVRVAPESGIPEGEARVYEVEGTPILVCRVEGKLYAIDDLCTHDDGPLGEGQLEGCEVECPRHGARFDVRTGQATRMPAAAPVRSFPLKVIDGQVWIEVETE